MKMSPNDIDTFVLRLHDFLSEGLGLVIDDNEDYNLLANFVADQLDKFVTKERNYN
jgi:hypothetical protein